MQTSRFSFPSSHNQPLKLEDPVILPAHLRQKLAAFRPLFLENRFIDSFIREPGIAEVADEVEAYLSNFEIHAYHCTKEPYPGFYQSRGLRLTDVRTHQAEFLAEHGYRFSASQLATIQQRWQEYFVKGRQAELRDGQIWACLSRSLVQDPGVEWFFNYFGGEAIHMPLADEPGIGEILANIGHPVVVEVSMPVRHLRAYSPLSYTVLSQYHTSVREDAHVFESEACCTVPVPPEKVLAVTAREQFDVQ